MPYCAICDVQVSESEARGISALFIGRAIEAGLRPPAGKLRRSAEMIAKGSDAAAHKEAEFEAQWVERFTAQTSGEHQLCPSCRDRASKALGAAR